MPDMTIEYPHGCMVIHLERFFPCSQQTAKKLLKIIAEDKDHASELIERCLSYCIQLVGQRDIDMQYCKDTYNLTRMDRETAEQLLRGGRDVDNSPLTFGRRREYEDKVKRLKSKEASLEKSYRQADRDIKMLNRNIENIEKFMAAKGW